MAQRGEKPAVNENGRFEDMDDAIAAAVEAQKQLVKLTLEERGKIVEAIRQAARDHPETFPVWP